MKTKPLAVITRGPSDILEILTRSQKGVTVIDPAAVGRRDLGGFPAIALLGGTAAEPLLLEPRARAAVEGRIAAGARVFSEYCESIGSFYAAPPVSTRFERIVVCGGTAAVPGLVPGDVLDDQCNMRIAPYDFVSRYEPPLLQYTRAQAHGKIDPRKESQLPVPERALWFHHPATLLVCTFRMCNFNKARFAPAPRWKALISYILEWLCGRPIDLGVLAPPYSVEPVGGNAGAFEQRLAAGVERAMGWFHRAGMLVNNGRDGVMEGMGTEILPDGEQQVRTIVRNDCTGEAALAFFLHHMLSGRRRSGLIAERLMSWCFSCMQVREEGPLRGMMRWTPSAWQVCYADDNARVIIPQLLMNLYAGRATRQAECVEALRFLVRTTGTDGLRVMRTDGDLLDAVKLHELSSTPAAYPSAHYNGYYLGALLLAYRLTGIEEFRDVGVRGLSTIMGVYPETKRETSETAELCRLVLPLSFLYWVTGAKEHRDWLYRVVDDLGRFRHPSGGYLEWDSGYKASLSRTVGGEASLLTNNGDPVIDILYSMNWLPIGYMQAWFVTGDEKFRSLWRDAATFLLSCQVHSRNRRIDGAWTRAFDVELQEVFGSSSDIGWGPWAIESGWTVGEIAAGLMMGKLAGKLKGRYDSASPLAASRAASNIAR